MKGMATPVIAKIPKKNNSHLGPTVGRVELPNRIRPSTPNTAKIIAAMTRLR
jgi:hypothetical protein